MGRFVVCSCHDLPVIGLSRHKVLEVEQRRRKYRINVLWTTEEFLPVALYLPRGVPVRFFYYMRLNVLFYALEDYLQSVFSLNHGPLNFSAREAFVI